MRRALIAILLLASIATGQTVNPGRVNVVTTPWSVNWLTHNSDASALTDLGYSAWEQTLLGSANLAAWLATAGAGTPAIALVDDADWPTWSATAHLGVYNVRHYGAAGDGVTDDTTAFTDALAAIDANDGGTLYVPPGLYVVTAPLTWIPSDEATPLAIVGDGVASRIAQATANTDLLVLGDAADGDPAIESVLIRDVMMMTVSGTGNAISGHNVIRSMFERVFVPGAGQYGIWLHGCIITALEQPILSANYAASELAGVGNPTDAWLRIEAATGAWTQSANAITISNPCIEGGDCNGVEIIGPKSRGVTVHGGTVENIAAPGTAFVVSRVVNLRIDNVYCEGIAAACPLTNVRGAKLWLQGGNGWDLQGCHSVTIGGLCAFGASDYLTVDPNCRAVTIRDLVTNHRMSNINIQTPDCDMGLVVDYADTYIADKAAWGAGLATQACPIMINGVQAWDDPNTLSAPWALEGTPDIDVNNVMVFGGAPYSAKVTVVSPAAYDGIAYTIPDAYLDQWVGIEAWVYLVHGEVRLNVTTPSRALQAARETGVWIRMMASVRAHGSQKTVRITSGAATVPDTVFYVGAVNMWAQTDPAFRATGSATPVGAVTPSYLGQEYYDASAGKWYKSKGFTNADWVALN